MILLYIVTFGTLASQRHYTHETSTFDLGNYDQAIWNVSQGNGPILTTTPDLAANRMGFHVEPILFLIGPLYWFWANPLLLLWLQTLSLGLAAWPIYLLAKRRLGSGWWAIVIVVMYLSMPALQSVTLFDFHAVALSPFFMLWAIYFLDQALVSQGRSAGFWLSKQAFKNRDLSEVTRPTHQFYIFSAIFFVLAMATKEDVPLHVLMVGLYTLLGLRQWRVGLVLIAVSLGWAMIAFGVVIPAYRLGGGQSPYVKFFPSLGATPLEIALSPILKPFQVMALVFTSRNLAVLRMLTVPFAGLNLLGLPIFILAAPTLAISFLSKNPLLQELETWHYAAPALPFVTLAAIDGLAHLNRLTTNTTKSKDANTVFLILILIVPLGYHYFRGYSPLSKPFHWPQATEHHRLGDDIAHSLPPNAKLQIQAELGPHFTQRDQVTVWTGPLAPEADYLILDVSHPKFWNVDNAHANFISSLVYQDQFGLVRTEDGYLVAKNGAPPAPTQEGFQDFLFADDIWDTAPHLATFDNWLALVGVEPHTRRETEAEVTLYFKVLSAPERDYFVHLYLLNAQGETVGVTKFQQPVLVWWPTHLWQTGDLIKIRFNTLTWWTGDGNQNQFSYAVGLLREDEPWQIDDRLSVGGDYALPENLAYVHSFERVFGMIYPADHHPTWFEAIR
ncbi:MAG: DUF2079 domain-containing protein [Chloroflexota bacterium]